MQPLSYKEFIKQVKNRLSKMSKADLDDMILNWAEKELPSNRPNFIGKMIIPEPGDLNTADGEALLSEIDAFSHRVENGDYCIGWGWDNDIYEERDWGDESWADEADDFFLEARELLLVGDYQLAKEAYRRLLETLEMGYEPGHLPGDPDITRMLKVDLPEQLALYLRAIYMDSPPSQRPAMLFETINKYRPLFGNIGLADINEALHSELPGFDSFLESWILLLENQSTILPNHILREALFLKGGIPAISELARQQADKYPRAFLDWIQALEDEGKTDAIIDVAREGLKTIPKDYSIRAEVAEVISSLGERLNDRDLMLEGYQESFYSNPSSKYLTDLYSTAIDCKCFETVRDQVEQRAWELDKQNKGLVISYYHSDLNRSHLTEGLLYRILILGGRYVKMFELCKRKGSLGWSGGNNPKPYFINYTMVLLSDNGRYTKVLNNEWYTLLTDSTYVVDSNLTDKYNKIIAHTINDIELTEEQKAIYLQWCSKEIGKRVDAIIGNQYRKSYYKAANLLVAMAETMANMGEKQKGIDLIEKYRRKYPRHSAFKGDLNHSIKESGLLC